MKKCYELASFELMRIAYISAMKIDALNHHMFSTEEIIEGMQYIIYLIQVGESKEISDFLENHEDGDLTKELEEILKERKRMLDNREIF